MDGGGLDDELARYAGNLRPQYRRAAEQSAVRSAARGAGPHQSAELFDVIDYPHEGAGEAHPQVYALLASGLNADT